MAMITRAQSSAVEKLNQPRKSGIFGQKSRFGAALRAALTELAPGDDAGAVLEELQVAAAREERTGELAAAYAEELSAAHGPLKTLPPVQRLEACLQAAWI